MTEQNVLGLIPARGGSKGIPKKNIRDLNGDPLIAHTIEAGEQATSIDHIVVSTDNQEIASVAEEHGADVPFPRPKKLATDETPTGPVVSHTLETLNPDFTEFVLLQPTSPLRSAIHIDEAMELYRSEGATSVISVYEDHSYRWRRTPSGAKRINYTGDRIRRQDKSPEYIENGAVYIVDVPTFLETEDFQAGTTHLYEMDEKSSIDIDTPYDLWLAEKVLTEWRNEDK